MTRRRFEGARVTVVAAFDSFLRAGHQLALALEAEGAEVEHRIVLARVGQLSEAQLRDMGVEGAKRVLLDALVTPEGLGDRDLVIVALGSLRSRRFALRLHERFAGRPRRPAVLSLFPGLIFRMHLESFSSRMAADLLLLNSPVDLERYRALQRGLGDDVDNAMCGGLSFLPLRQPDREPSPRPIVFAAQPTVPAGYQERRFVVERLADLARAHPGTQVVIKPRHRRGETSLHRVTHHYEDLLGELRSPPSNLRVDYTPLRAQLEAAGAMLTFSSTAALESVRLGVPTRVLTDLGVSESLGNHFFVESGLLATLDDIGPGLECAVDPAWEARHVVGLDERKDAVLERIAALLEVHREAPRALPPPSPRLVGRSSAFDAWYRARVGLAESASVGVGGSPSARRAREVLRPLKRVASRLLARLPGAR